MKDEHDKKTGDLSPNARRQAAYAERQRAMGRKKFSYWMRPTEARKVAAFLEQLRKEEESTMNNKVILNGKEVDMAAARALMDDELCESIHGTVDTDQEFLDAYCAAHREKYGEAFVI